MTSYTVWPGWPYPLGATWNGEGVNFALYSEHGEKVELCIFDEKGRRELQRIPLRRMGGENDAANAVLFLASDEAAYITGAAIPVDGGSSIPRRALSPAAKPDAARKEP